MKLFHAPLRLKAAVFQRTSRNMVQGVMCAYACMLKGEVSSMPFVLSGLQAALGDLIQVQTIWDSLTPSEKNDLLASPHVVPLPEQYSAVAMLEVIRNAQFVDDSPVELEKVCDFLQHVSATSVNIAFTLSRHHDAPQYLVAEFGLMAPIMIGLSRHYEAKIADRQQQYSESKLKAAFGNFFSDIKI